jgi:undecaprenyl-phosphate 4-deoxy-4-formamido-L-arabinose transferase
VEISIVIPVFNGAKSLLELNRRIGKTLVEMDMSYEIIYVDDCSKDQSRQVIRELSQESKTVRYVFFKQNSGQQAAIFAGLEKSSGKIIVTLDDDLQHPPEDIALLVDSLEGYEGVFAFPIEKPHKRYRKMGSLLTDRLFNVLFSKEDHLKISSYRAIRRSLVDKMIQEKTNFVYISALMLKHSGDLKTIFSQQLHRKYGDSNYTFRRLLKLYGKIIVYYSGIKVFACLKNKKNLYIIEEEN